jgi:hypothetical protein
MTPSRSALIVVVLYLLHQDLWFWDTATPVVFGIFPIGLFYHVAYTLVTALVLWLLVSRHWPIELEDGVEEDTGCPHESRTPGVVRPNDTRCPRFARTPGIFITR